MGPSARPFPPKNDWVTRAAVAASILLLVVATFGVWLRYRPRPFDPVRWRDGGGPARGLMLKSLLGQTDFVGFSRTEVESYLGAADFDERQFWYDLGPADRSIPLDPRASVGDTTRLFGVFSHDAGGMITSVLYNHRRPILGSSPFDSAGWFGADRSQCTRMFTDALGQLRNLGLSQPVVTGFLGPPDGARIRAHYDVGTGGALIGGSKALILEYDQNDVVSSSTVTD